jgi:hypothetical protein
MLRQIFGPQASGGTQAPWLSKMVASNTSE